MNPTSLRYNPRLHRGVSRWTLVRRDGSLGELVVTTDVWGNDLTYREVERDVGASLSFASCLRNIDPEIAKGIVLQIRPGQRSATVGFDGVVREVESDGSEVGVRHMHYWEMTRGTPASSDEEQAIAKDELDSVHAASPEEIGAMLRALMPIEWKREEQLREECGMLSHDT